MGDASPRLPSRRAEVGGIAGNLAGAAATLSPKARSQPDSGSFPLPRPLSAPRNLYYGPRFTAQSQPWPG